MCVPDVEEDSQNNVPDHPGDEESERERNMTLVLLAAVQRFRIYNVFL